MDIPLRFRLPNRTTWQLAGSGIVLALVAYALAARGFGFGSFIILAGILYALAFQFGEWRRVRFSLGALALALGAMLSSPLLVTPFVAAASVGILATLGYLIASLPSDQSRLAARVFGIVVTFLASLVLFNSPLEGTVGAVAAFAGFALAVALMARDEVRAWGALRVGSGALLSAALGLAAAELAALTGLLPLGPVRAAAFTTLALFMAREGLGEAYHGGLRRGLIFQGLTAFFVLGVLIFASVSWEI